MFSSDGTGDFLSLSHLNFCHQSNLHFYGIINEEESHLHFLAHRHYVVWRTAVVGETSVQKASGSGKPCWSCGAKRSFFFLSFFQKRRVWVWVQ